MPKSRKRKYFRILYPLFGVLVALGVALAYLYFSGAAIPLIRDEQGIAPSVLVGIGREGVGGDPDLNRLKNRISEPKSFTDYTVPQIIAINNDFLMQQGKRLRKSWYPSARLYAEEKESMGVRVTGYLLRARESGTKSANGYIDSLRDYHLWIADKPTAERRSTMLAEVAPRWKAVYPDWSINAFKRLADQKAKVRVTGWLLWDQDHASDVQNSRGTSWEVHPVTKFEVWSDSTWIEIKQLPERDSITVLPS